MSNITACKDCKDCKNCNDAANEEGLKKDDDKEKNK